MRDASARERPGDVRVERRDPYANGRPVLTGHSLDVLAVARNVLAPKKVRMVETHAGSIRDSRPALNQARWMSLSSLLQLSRSLCS